MLSLKNCPYCGSEAHLEYTNNRNWKCATHFVFVQCNFCGAKAKTYAVKDNPEKSSWECQACNDAINAWNKRVDG